jgi:DNA-binding NarL/FixJ family response regulator
MARPTILIADDHRTVVEGLVRLLRDQFEVVATVANATQLLDAAARLRPDVIIIDVSVPAMSGIEALRRLAADKGDTKIIVLTMHGDAELATEAMRAGASGFLVKHAAGEELPTAINEVLQGRIYLTPAMTRVVFARLSAPAPPAAVRLTGRKREVLRLIAEGRRMKEIADILSLSTRTVESHKYEMMHALGVQSTAQLVRYAVEHRLVGD